MQPGSPSKRIKRWQEELNKSYSVDHQYYSKERQKVKEKKRDGLVLYQWHKCEIKCCSIPRGG